MKILIVDDHPLSREGIKHILDKPPGNHTFGEASSDVQFMNALETRTWDIVLLDIDLEGLNTLGLLRFIKKDYPDLPILVLTASGEELYGIPAIQAGADGFITKWTLPQELVTAVNALVEKRKYFSPRLLEKLTAFARESTDTKPHHALTTREFQIMMMIVNGHSNKEIAAQLFLSDKTISTHRSHIYQKLHLSSEAELIRYCLAEGLIR